MEWLCDPAEALAEHILDAAPKSAKVVFENDVLRVILTTMRKGQKIPMHSHNKGFSYSLNAGKIRVTLEDGKSMVFKVPKGDSGWSDPGETHAVENLGETLQELYLEYKG